MLEDARDVNLGPVVQLDERVTRSTYNTCAAIAVLSMSEVRRVYKQDSRSGLPHSLIGPDVLSYGFVIMAHIACEEGVCCGHHVCSPMKNDEALSCQCPRLEVTSSA